MAVIKKTVAIHPMVDSLIRKTWAALIEKGYNATYSATVNFMILTAMFEAKKPEGLSDETMRLLVSFLTDASTIDELNLEDNLTAIRETIRKLKREPEGASE